MGRGTIARVADHKLIRSVVQTNTGAVTSFTVTIPRTISGDTIVCFCTTSGSPTFSASGAGATWQTLTRAGSSSPYTSVMVGINATVGSTSFTVTPSGSATVTCITLVINGIDASVLNSYGWGWSGSFGTTSPSFTPNVGDLVLLGTAQFNGSAMTVTATDSRGQQVQQRSLDLYNQRNLAVFAFVDRTGLSQTVTPTWSLSQTGSGIIIPIPHL